MLLRVGNESFLQDWWKIKICLVRYSVQPCILKGMQLKSTLYVLITTGICGHFYLGHYRPIKRGNNLISDYFAFNSWLIIINILKIMQVILRHRWNNKSNGCGPNRPIWWYHGIMLFFKHCIIVPFVADLSISFSGPTCSSPLRSAPMLSISFCSAFF